MVDEQLPTNTEISVNELPKDMPGVTNTSEPPPVFSPPMPKKRLLWIVIGVCLIIFTLLGSYILYRNVFTGKETQESSYIKAKQLTDEAKRHYADADFKNTEEKLTESLKMYPNNPNALSSLIRTIALRGNQTGQEGEAFSRAKPYIDKALKDYPDDPDILLSIGYIHETNGDYETALKFYEDALRVDENNANALFHKGHVLEFLGRQEEAFGLYSKAYSINPNDPLIIIAEGRHKFNSGKQNEAYDLYLKVSDLNNVPNHLKSEALTNASIIRRSELIYMQEAIDLSRKAVEADPNFSPALATYGFNLAINGKAEGLDYLKKSIDANPRISANYYLTALILRAIKKYDEAISYLNLGIERIENDNTILDPSLKAKKRVEMIYELGKTYSIANGRPETLPTLILVTQMDPSYRQTIKKHYEQSGLFKDLAQNEQFLSLIR